MTEAPGRSLRDVLRWVWDTFGSYITTAALALLPSGTAVALYGRDLVTSSYRMPGWAILIVVALVGPLAFLLIREGKRWRKRKRGPLVAEYQGPRALYWPMGQSGAADVMSVVGDFNIMNRASGNAVTPRSILVVSYRRWGVLPARRHVDGFGLWEPIPPHSMRRDERLHWDIEPPVLRRGDTLVARVCLIDHLGGENWTDWLRWSYMGRK